MSEQISVIVPFYNNRATLSRCLDSLLNQTLKQITIICVDDGSTDGSIEIAQEYQSKHKNIVIVRRKNGGLSAARNSGLDHVQTKYVMFCDSDDAFEPLMCETMLKIISEKDADIAACGTKMEYKAHREMAESDAKYYRINFSGCQYINDSIITDTNASVCNKIFKVDILKQYEIRFPEKLNNEDYYFYNAFMSVAQKIAFTNQKFYIYTRYPDSIMSDNFGKDIYSPDHLEVAKKLFIFYKKNGFLNKHVNLFWRQFIESFEFSYRYSARKYHRQIEKNCIAFIKKYYNQYTPTNKALDKKLTNIMHLNFFTKSLRKIKYFLVKGYKKISIPYRQQNNIKQRVLELEQTTQELIDYLDGMNN